MIPWSRRGAIVLLLLLFAFFLQSAAPPNISFSSIARYLRLSQEQIAGLTPFQKKIYQEQVEPTLVERTKALKFHYVKGSTESNPMYFAITDSLSTHKSVGPKSGILIASLQGHEWTISSFTPFPEHNITCSESLCKLPGKKIQIMDDVPGIPPIVLIRYSKFATSQSVVFAHYVLSWSHTSGRFEVSGPITTALPLEVDTATMLSLQPEESLDSVTEDLFDVKADKKTNVKGAIQTPLDFADIL